MRICDRCLEDDKNETATENVGCYYEEDLCDKHFEIWKEEQGERIRELKKKK